MESLLSQEEEEDMEVAQVQMLICTRIRRHLVSADLASVGLKDVTGSHLHLCKEVI